MSSFLDRAALPLALGIPVFPIKVGEKSPALSGVRLYESATTNKEQVEKWNRINPEFNCGCATGDIWFLDVDSDAGRTMLESGSGILLNEIPTLVIRSSGEKRHYYFKHNAFSRSLGDRVDGKNAAGEAFSARLKDSYVVGPGSIHRDTGTEYEVVQAAEPIDCPQPLLDYLHSLKLAEGSWEAGVEADPSDILADANTLANALEAAGISSHRESLSTGGYKLVLSDCPWEQAHGPRPSGPSTTVALLSTKQEMLAQFLVRPLRPPWLCLHLP